jgi:hypothetical protein
VGTLDVSVDELHLVALVQARQKLVHDALDVWFTEPVLGVQEAGQVVLHVLFDQNELVCTRFNQECVE